jgi:L-fuconolactonase
MRKYHMHIDAEVHFWKYDKAISDLSVQKNKLLQQNYLPEQIEQTLHRNEIDACIATVTEHAEVETRFLAELAKTHPIIRGVCGWIDLWDKRGEEKIHEFSQHKEIRGYQLPANVDFNLPHPVMNLLKEYQYCLDISVSPETDFNSLNHLIGSHPDHIFILKDSGNPDAKHVPDAAWKKQISALAENPNLSCKVSGLLTRGNRKSWKPADFYPFLEILFDLFGTERLMYASDWPFILLAGIYVQWKSLLEKFTENMVQEDRDKFFGENAHRIYRL